MPTRTVYVVDDDQMVRRSTAFLLGSAGFASRGFSDGSDFLDEAKDLPSGCVLLDVRMPGIDGLSVIDALGAQIAGLPVVMMTGHGDISIAVRAMRQGASDFLEKPFRDSDLLEAVGRVFGALDMRPCKAPRAVDAQIILSRLTPREQDVLSGLVAGLANKALAHELGLSVRTVEMHRGNIMARLGLKALSDVLRLAFDAGVQPLSVKGARAH